MTDILFDGTNEEKIEYLLMKIQETKKTIETNNHTLNSFKERYKHPKRLSDITHRPRLKFLIKAGEKDKIKYENELKDYTAQYEALLAEPNGEEDRIEHENENFTENTDISFITPFDPSFSNSIIRRPEMQFEIYGADSFELVTMVNADEIKDHNIEIIGPDFNSFEPGSAVDVAYIAEISGKNMQEDIEPVIENNFNYWINCLEGAYHTGQRDQIRVRVSKKAFDAGFRAKDLGEMLWTMIKKEYGDVVDKCQIKIITDPEKCAILKEGIALPKYIARDI